MKENLYSPREVAEMANADITTIHAAIKRGDLRALRIGNGPRPMYRITESGVGEYIKVVTPNGLVPFRPSELPRWQK